MPACLATATRVLPVPAEKGRVELVRYPFKKFGNNVVDSFDVALPVVHGIQYEDGPSWASSRCSVCRTLPAT